MVELSIIIPVYNESEIIETVVNNWMEALEKLAITYQIKLYNDGSTDTTGKILDEIAKQLPNQVEAIHKENSGHGPTILTGYNQSLNSQWVFQVDSDGEMSPDHFVDLWEAREAYDFIIGERIHRDSSPFRKLMSFLSYLLIRLFFGSKIRDVNSPYRLMRVRAFKEIFPNIPTTTFAPNIIISGMANRLRVKTHQIPFHTRTTGVSSLSTNIFKLLKISIRSFKETVIYSLEQKKRPYLILAIIWILFALHYSPLFDSLGYDKEVFQYMGMILDNQQLPYTDAFDHKPPGIYLLNYLGFIATPNSTWGIFVMLNVLGFIATLMVYRTAARLRKSQTMALLISAIFMAIINHPELIEGGNLTRQVAAYLTVILLSIFFHPKKSTLSWIGMGALIGAIFLTQQNEILGTGFLIAYGVIFRERFTRYPLRSIITQIAYVLLGLSIPIVIVGAIVFQWNNLNDFIEQAFLFNFSSYIPINDEPFILKMARVFSAFSTHTAVNTTLWFSLLILLVNHFLIRHSGKTSQNLLLLLAAFLLQFMATSIAGNTPGHYFLMFVPYLCFVYILISGEKKHQKSSQQLPQFAIHKTTLIALILTLSLQSSFHLFKTAYYRSPDRVFFQQMMERVDDVKQKTGQFYSFDATFLRINFNLSIPAPTKWIYTHFADHAMYREIINDLSEHKTTYILIPNLQIQETPQVSSFLQSFYQPVLHGEHHTLFQKNKTPEKVD